MKKIKLFLFGLMISLPFKVNAALALRCAPDNVESGSDINCILYAPSSCYSFEGTLALPEGLSVGTITPYKSFKALGSGTNLSFSGPGNNSYEKIALITIKTPILNSDANFEIKIKGIKFKYLSTDKDFSTIEDLNSIVKLKAKTSTTTTTTTLPPTTKKINYILTLDANGGDLETQTVSCTPTGGTCDVDLSSVNMPIKDKYIFRGWDKDKDCTNGTTALVSLTGDLTYYACWTGDKTVDKTITLDSLAFKNIEFAFNKDVFEYILNVNEDVNKLDVEVLASGDIKVDVSGNDNLKAGTNIILITLTKGNSYNIYKINVIKNDSSGKNVGDKTLNSLNIKGYNLKFDSKVFEYTLKVDKETSVLDITPTLTNGNYTYEIIGNSNLQNGSVVKIVITDLNHETNTYSIKIDKTNIFEDYKIYFIGLGILILCLIIYFIIRTNIKKNKSNDSTKNKSEEKDNKTEKIEVLNV